ncbi:MAG: DinB family protein [Planctomycetota bacterium]
MSDTVQASLAAQFEAGLRMLNSCIELCPDARWHQPVVKMTYDQVVFHTLFFTDVYLGRTLDDVKRQDFHRQHIETFAEYEEIGGGLQQAHYDKPFASAYLEHCRDKATRTLAEESMEALLARPGFEWLKFSRMEAHLYNLRHIQHHAGALSILVRGDTQQGIPWAGSGWDLRPWRS